MSSAGLFNDGYTKATTDQLIADAKIGTLKFTGYVQTTDPSSSGTIPTGSLWYNNATLPAVSDFPVTVQEWDGSVWTATTYTAVDWDVWAVYNSTTLDYDESYWFKNVWNRLDFSFDASQFVQKSVLSAALTGVTYAALS